MSLGGELFKGSSKLFSGPLGVVKVGFNGFDLGKTTAETMLAPDQDIKGIIYQQEGTKDSDSVRTGIEYILKCTFGEINTGILIQLMSGITSKNFNPTLDSGTFGRELYESMREADGGPLKIAAVDSNGEPLDTEESLIYCYEAIPIVTGDALNWGADTQRALVIEFRIKFHIFSTGESITKYGAFGYWGDPVVEDLPAVVWPDVNAPYIVSAVIQDAVDILLTFNKVLTLVAAVTLTERFIANINNVFSVPVTAVISAGPNDDEVLLTFAAASFLAGDVVTLSLTAGSVKDVDLAQNIAVSDLAVSNPLV